MTQWLAYGDEDLPALFRDSYFQQGFPVVIFARPGNHGPNMSATPLTVLAHVNAKPGKEAEMRKELLSLVAPSRKDAGCLNYDLHQAADNPALFMFHENWTSKAHLDAHLRKPDLQAVLARVGQLVAAPPQITLWEKVA